MDYHNNTYYKFYLNPSKDLYFKLLQEGMNPAIIDVERLQSYSLCSIIPPLSLFVENPLEGMSVLEKHPYYVLDWIFTIPEILENYKDGVIK